MAGTYEKVTERVIYAYKFDGARSAAGTLAQALDAAPPYLPTNTILVPVPTAPARIRQRGYDQTLLLAKELAKLRGLNVVHCLERQHDLRQVGSGRKQRQQQAKSAFRLKKRQAEKIKGKPVLLIDDVLTTGATLSAAAELLYAAGSMALNAAVVAWQLPPELKEISS
ncbi:MAG: ComF family protein [Candidatus Saccharimonadales bacterium]